MKDRVTAEDISQIQPKAELSSLDINTFLPSVQDSLALNEEFTVLIARILTHRLPAFRNLEGAVPGHIKHKYSDQMQLRSDVVSKQYIQSHIAFHNHAVLLDPSTVEPWLT